jgi:hypothetical protein
MTFAPPFARAFRAAKSFVRGGAPVNRMSKLMKDGGGHGMAGR